MEKKLKEVADGVVNMVTTPFKSKSATATSAIKSSTTSSSSSNNSSSSSSLLRRRKLKILTSLDPSAMMEVLSDLNPATTVVITINIDSEGENECQEITAFVKEWLLSMTTGITTTASTSSRRAQNEEIVSKHMYLVVTTGNEISNHQQRRTKNNITSSNNTFILPRHSQCEPFSTCSPAGLLPLSFIFGWDIISSILLGVHDMDIHFVDTCPRQNIPIILALIDVWNEAFLQSNGRILTPYVHAFGSYPRYVAALEHRVLNATANMPETKSFGSRGRNEEPQPVIDGGYNVYNNYGRGGGYAVGGGGSSSSSSSSNLASTEFLTTLDPPLLPQVGNSSSTTIGGISHEEQLIMNHDKRMCSLFARADTLAYGTSNTTDHKARIFHSPGSPPTIIRNDTMTSQNNEDGGVGNSSTKIEIGNQPSTILFCGKCDAFTIGQLIALCEHRALVKAWLWDIDPFMMTKSSGVQQERQEYLSEKLYIYNNLLNEGVDLDEADGSNELPSDSSATGGGGGGARMMNSATNTVLKHYATRLKNRRRDDKPRTPSRLFS
jgi:glucose-6-phosphate isomerase